MLAGNDHHKNKETLKKLASNTTLTMYNPKRRNIIHPYLSKTPWHLTITQIKKFDTLQPVIYSTYLVTESQ